MWVLVKIEKGSSRVILRVKFGSFYSFLGVRVFNRGRIINRDDKRGKEHKPCLGMKLKIEMYDMSTTASFNK